MKIIRNILGWICLFLAAVFSLLYGVIMPNEQIETDVDTLSAVWNSGKLVIISTPPSEEFPPTLDDETIIH